MKFRNFSDILAQWQGGVQPRPGYPVVRYVRKTKLEKLFGKEIPTAITVGNLFMSFTPVSEDYYRAVIKTT